MHDPVGCHGHAWQFRDRMAGIDSAIRLHVFFANEKLQQRHALRLISIPILLRTVARELHAQWRHGHPWPIAHLLLRANGSLRRALLLLHTEPHMHQRFAIRLFLISICQLFLYADDRLLVLAAKCGTHGDRRFMQRYRHKSLRHLYLSRFLLCSFFGVSHASACLCSNTRRLHG